VRVVTAPLDDLLPDHDARDVHEIWVDASCSRVWSALNQVTLREMPAFRALLFLRQPSLPLAHRNRKLVSRTDRPLLAEMASGAFVALVQRPPSELVLGMIAKPWRPASSLRAIDRPGFVDFAEPGWVKIVLGFQLEELDGRTRLTTETRVRATDAAARRWFRLYWLPVGWGSAATRRSWLRAVRRRAEAAGPDEVS
jgi:hypothetical protein